MKRNIHAFLAVALVLGGWATMPVQAAQDGGPKDLGFLIDNNFSTFISVNGEVILDVFEAVFSSNPDVEDDFTPAVLEGTDFFGVGIPDVVVANVLSNIIEAIESTNLPGPGVLVAFNPDPFIAYNMTFTNPTDAPAEFIYNFLFPVLPVVGATQVVSQLSFDLVDADGDGSAILSPNLNSSVNPNRAIQSVAFLEGGIFGAFTDIGFGVGTSTINDLGETLLAPEITAGPEAVNAFDALTVFGRFILSAGDSVTLTGLGGLVEAGGFLPTLASFNFDNFPSTVIPEPSSAVLLLLGLAAGLRRSRNRRGWHRQSLGSGVATS